MVHSLVQGGGRDRAGWWLGQQGSRVVVATEQGGDWDRAGWWLGQSREAGRWLGQSRVVVGTEQGGGWNRAGKQGGG